jgi:Ca2+-binding EF-hand superfamily protein
LSVPEAIDENGDGEIDSAELQQAISYWKETETVPNTGVAGDNEEMTTERLQNLIERWKNGG